MVRQDSTMQKWIQMGNTEYPPQQEAEDDMEDEQAYKGKIEIIQFETDFFPIWNLGEKLYSKCIQNMNAINLIITLIEAVIK